MSDAAYVKPAGVNLVVALPAEARPLVAHFRLTRVAESPFPVYAGADMHLVVCGIGCAASAMATGYLAAYTPTPAAIWLNVGIAGHQTAAPGSEYVAARVRHHHGGPSWYPGLPRGLATAAAEIVSFDAPVTQYPAATCCDMEAAGFMAAATRLTVVDLIQAFKIVSDNEEHSIETINREFVQNLVRDALPGITALVDALRDAAAVLPAPTAPAAASGMNPRWHLSASQRIRFTQEFARYRALSGDAVLPASVSDCSEGRAALARLQEVVASRLPGFDL